MKQDKSNVQMNKHEKIGRILFVSRKPHALKALRPISRALQKSNYDCSGILFGNQINGSMVKDLEDALEFSLESCPTHPIISDGFLLALGELTGLYPNEIATKREMLNQCRGILARHQPEERP